MIIDVLFPRRCPVCGEVVMPRGNMICPGCVKKLDPVKEPMCKKCGKELSHDQDEYCFDCYRRPHSYHEGRGLFKYNAAAASSIAAIKYKNKREYLDFYAQVMGRRYEAQARRWMPEVLVPVPVHPARKRARGYNQAEELARRLGSIWEIPVDSRLLVRTKKTAPQKELGAAERLKNLREAFSIAPERYTVFQDNSSGAERIPKCVLLVDDIYTTGSTIEACTGVLHDAGVRNVYFLTICIGYGR